MLNLPRAVSNGTINIAYIYSAQGEKLAKKMKDNTYQYYAGSMVYKNDKSLNYLLFEEGMVTKTSNLYSYEYHLKDHLGNTRVAFQPNGATTTVTQIAGYYPFGSSYLPLYNAGTDNKYLYNGKEKQDDVLSGTFLDWYDYGARFYDPKIGRWHSVDPKSQEMRGWSPYAFCYGNPLRFLDIDGMKPGDLFKTPQNAARDFGLSFNAISITSNTEYGSSIYVVQKNGKTYYTYTQPNAGSSRGVNCSPAPDGTKKVANVHSHAAYDEKIDTQYGNGNDIFSSTDKWTNYNNNIDGYLVTPEGNFKKYNVNLAKETTISSDMASDPDDPNRVNKINPTNPLPGMKSKKEDSKKENENQDWTQIINYLLSQNPYIQVIER